MTDWIEQLIDTLGAFGVGLLMFVENVFPPVPSEVVLPLAGYRASQGDLSVALALIGGTLGSVIGVTLWYFAGRWLGADRLKRFAERHGRWLTLTPKDIDDVGDWFDRHGGKAVLIGRLVPGVRSLISIPAGICGMPLTRFLILTAIGTSAWNAVLIYAGFTLGDRFERVHTYMSPVGNVILGAALIYYLYRVVTFDRRVRRDKDARGSNVEAS